MSMSSVTTLQSLVNRAQSLPEEMRTEAISAIAEVIDSIESRQSIYTLNSDERAGIECGLDAMRTGQFAKDADVAEIFARARTIRA